MNFYTGITTIAMFKAVFKMLLPFTSYWEGTKKFIAKRERRNLQVLVNQQTDELHRQSLVGLH